MKRSWTFGLILAAACAPAQSPSEPLPPVATLTQIMLDLIHPASNQILFVVSRGGPKDEAEWAAVRRSAVTLAESGNLLIARGRGVPAGPDAGQWRKDVKLLVDAGTAAYRAALAKDSKALAAVAEPLDASCTTCHKHYRPNVFPKDGGSK